MHQQTGETKQNGTGKKMKWERAGCTMNTPDFPKKVAVNAGVSWNVKADIFPLDTEHVEVNLES